MKADLPSLVPKVLEANWYGPVRSWAVDLVVIHTAETSETGSAAEAVARYFDNLPEEKKASAHFVVDNDSAIQCVPLANVAYAAPGANHNGLQIELAGRAAQTAAGWADAYSKAMLTRAAQITANLCKRYGLPYRTVVGVAGLKAGKRGLTAHRYVSEAFHRSDHTDPGTAFPWTSFVNLVKAAYVALPDR